MKNLFVAITFAALATNAVAQTAISSQADRPIVPFEDNSFLLEEAYNQEAGVVQHIAIMERGENNAINASFGQEWPLGGQTHQFSYTVPLIRPGGAGAEFGLGDITLDYRLQALGGESRLAVAPRVSLSLPSGGNARGNGSYGIGVGLPISYSVSPTITTHTNLSVLHVPGASAGDGRTGNAEYSVGQSVIYKAYPQAHVMLESLWTGGDADSFVISPGVRFALNFKSGLQIVPGFALPYETRGGGPTSVLFYLSIEHPFAHPQTNARYPSPAR
ncbi:MAG: transporter [Gemmatimonadaceae bacterium]|nr:transporter [Gemmatimonadaceae bacterium]